MNSEDSVYTLLEEIAWLEKVINTTIAVYLQHEGIEQNDWLEISPPDIGEKEDVYSNFVKEKELNVYDRLTLALAIAPHLKPEVLDVFFGQNSAYNRNFTEFGGIVDKEHSGFLPTGQTLLFIAASNHPELRLELIRVFDSDHLFKKEQILELSVTQDHIPNYNGVLSIN